MTGRNRSSGKIETTIENCRSEAKWKRVIELADDLKNGSPNYESLSNFLIGEGGLESFLEENEPIEQNFLKAKNGLADSKNHLVLVTGENGRKAGIALDAHLLLAKLFYACGQYEESLENFVKAELNSLSEKELTLRSLKILAESYAIKGMLLENRDARITSKFKLAERESEMISCFERAADLGILYLQEQDVVTAGYSETRRIGAILETALQRSPIVLIKAGKLHNAIERYRSMLNAIETRTTQMLRLTLARQLAEVLLRGVSGTIYTSPFNISPSKNLIASKKLWKPRKYFSRSQFLPKNQPEETILLLLIAEALAVRDAVLSQSPEFKDVRSHAMGNATAVYDLLTLATVRWHQICLLHESFEKALKFSFGEQHVWQQYALSLSSLSRHAQALRALKESSKLVSHDPLPCLISARICYENLDLIREGLESSQAALSKEAKGLRPSRAQLYVGIGNQLIFLATALKSEKERYSRLAFDALEKAVQIDSNDHLTEFYLALQYAHSNNITDALTHIRVALSLRAEHSSSLHLLCLLLTANRRPREALYVLVDALQEFPENLNLLYVKAQLELHLQDVDAALVTVQKMLIIWKDIYELQTNGIEQENEKQSDTKSVLQFHTQMSDKDSNSVHAASLAASRIEHALSEAASSLSSFSPRPGPQKAWMIQMKIWLVLVDVYLATDLPNEAMNCIHEASQIYPLSHQVMYMRGKVYVYLTQWNDAKQCFLNAVSVNPMDTEALRYLGKTHHILGEPRLAEKMLKDAAKIDPTSPDIWFSLGQVMESLGDYIASADCMATALQLEPTCPILPFSTIALTFE